MKTITVMIPVYNAEVFLRETIDSVLCQSFPDFELLILDDGSTDRSAEIIQSYTDKRITYILCSHNFIQTINKGLECANSKYIALLDHDDLMVKNRLQIQHDFMEANPEIAACGGYMYSFGNFSVHTIVPLKHDEIIRTMLLYSPIPNPTGFIRREILISHGIKYKKGYSFSADYKFWSDIAKIGKLANIPDVLTLYRIHNQQTSVKQRDKCLKGGLKVKMEMLDYFFSHLKSGNELARLIDNEFIPAINHLGEGKIFSERTFFSLMYELIDGLCREGALEL
jgi:glycosyltransferase involved in cell wall biosynthesis